MGDFRKCQGLGFTPIYGEAGIFSDTCDSLGLNPQAIAAFGGRCGQFHGELALALPICCIEAGCCWPFSIRLTGWLLTADGTHWKPVHAAGGGVLRGSIGTWGRLLSPDCRRINIFGSLRDAMTAASVAHDEGHFCFLRPPDVCDFGFLLAIAGMSCRVVFAPFRGNLAWARAWLRFLREVGEPKAVPLPRATFSEAVGLKGAVI